MEEKDIDFFVEDIVKLREILVAKLQEEENSEEGELGEEELEEVSGGVVPLFAVAAVFAPLLILGGGFWCIWNSRISKKNQMVKAG